MKHDNIDKSYPRPQLVRDNYKILDGSWDFMFDYENVGEDNKWYTEFPKEREKIIVPFSYQTKLSGIGDKTFCPHIWYHKEVDYSNDYIAKKRLLLNIDGCDYLTKIWVNGRFIGEHKGGYTRITFDITDAVIKNNKKANIVVKATDTKNTDQLRGKQQWKDGPFACFYDETNGIWKSVWSEFVDKTQILFLMITPNYESKTCNIKFFIDNFKENLKVRLKISYKGRVLVDKIRDLPINAHNIKTKIRDIYFYPWDVDNPELYDVEITLLKGNQTVDKVYTYFGFRSIMTDEDKIFFNNEPIYLSMVLYQGYHKDSGLTAPSYDALYKDIEIAKELGFNGIRMHQKIEDERFYHIADILGMLIWCEMPSAYDYTENTAEEIKRDFFEVLYQYYNYPSIIAWVPFNESWGVPEVKTNIEQQCLTTLASVNAKRIDSTRLVISNDGWQHTISDIITLHNYSQDAGEFRKLLSNIKDKMKENFFEPEVPFADNFGYFNEPIMISEFAGIGYKNGKEDGWGYGDKVNSSDQFVERLSSLVKVIRDNKDICGFCVTQLTDVYQEINGLLDMDRKPKAEIRKLQKAIRGEL